MGLGPHASIPAWAKGKRIHFLASMSARSGSLGGETSLLSAGGGGQIGGILERRCELFYCPVIPLLYHEGSGVQHHPRIYAIFWGKNWENAPGAELRTQLLQMYEGLSGSSYMGILTQYFDSSANRVLSNSSVASYLDTSVAAPTSVNQSKLVEEIARAISVNGWQEGLESQFVVIPAPGSTYEESFAEGFCGYHSVDGPSTYTFLPYIGDEPFSRGCLYIGNGNADNATSAVASHEYAETATDPKLNEWYTSNGYEIADICASGDEQLPNGSWVTGLWDDHQSTCSVSDPEPPHVFAVTEPATRIELTRATVNGTVNPEDVSGGTTYHFEYGTTTSYGSATPEASAGSGITNQTVNQVLSGLASGTTYHFRIVATNATGTTYGEDKSLETVKQRPIVTTAAATGVVTTTYSSSFSSHGSGEGQLISPSDVTVDSSGNVWVADTGNGRLEEFSSAGTFIRALGSKGTGAGQFGWPEGVAIDPSGDVWATDSNHQRVEEWSSTGAFVKTVGWGVADGEAKWESCTASCREGIRGAGQGQFSYPSDLAIDAKGDIYVADRGNDRVQELNQSGEFVRSISRPEETEGPDGVALDAQGNIWVSYDAEAKIAEFDTEGKLLTRWGTKGTGAGKLESAYRLAFGPEGNIWVAEWGNNRVQVFKPTGKYVFGFGSKGTGLGQFEHANGIAFSRSGAIAYTLDAGTGDEPGKVVNTGGWVETWNVSAPAATLHGTVNPNGLATTYHFEYGELAALLNGKGTKTSEVGVGSGDTALEESQNISGLTSGTEYFFWTVASNGQGTEYGNPESFVIGPAAPHAETTQALGVSETAATLNGVVNPESVGTKDYFEYGTTTSYGSRTAESLAGAGISNTATAATLSGLVSKTIYHYRLVASSTLGTTYGADQEFATEPWSWSLTSTPPTPGETLNPYLNAVSCTSITACTAVGGYDVVRNGYEIIKSLVERWNGDEWAMQRVAPAPTERSAFEGVSCGGPSACIAVGSYQTGPLVEPAFSSLSESWNGSEWTNRPVREPSSTLGSYLQAASCSDASDCIAVGSYEISAGWFPLAERWGGSGWELQSMPAPSGAKATYPSAVSCPSLNVCFVAGYYEDSSGKHVLFAEQWKGGEWIVQSVPAPQEAQDTSLYGISCSSATACTAVGQSYVNGAGGPAPLAERWEGTAWSVQSPPSPPETTDANLVGVSCTSTIRCEASGVAKNKAGKYVTLAEQWRRAGGWQVQITPNPGEDSYLVGGVSCVFESICLAVGSDNNFSLAELYD